MWLFGPLAWSRVQLGFRREAIDSTFEFVDGVKDTPGEAPLRQLGKEPLDGVEARGGCWREAGGPLWMCCQTFVDLLMWVRCLFPGGNRGDRSGRHRHRSLSSGTPGLSEGVMNSHAAYAPRGTATVQRLRLTAEDRIPLFLPSSASIRRCLSFKCQ